MLHSFLVNKNWFYCFRLSRCLNKINMTSKAALECLKTNADLTEKTIQDLKNEMHCLTANYNKLRQQQLREENAKLTAAVEQAKKHLIQLETKNGTIQVPMPVVKSSSSPNDPQVEIQKPVVVETAIKSSLSQDAPVKPKKEKKVKESAPKQPIDEPPVDVGRLDLRIAKVEDVQKHPDADSLYVLKINCGEEKPRTVCSGLVKFVPMDDLKDRSVVLLCNLKPVKMRGITSEAMVMCASTPEAVEVLSPPKGCKPGDVVECDGYVRNPDPVMNPKKKIFETVAPDLATNDKLEACYKGTTLVTSSGVVSTKSLINCQIK